MEMTFWERVEEDIRRYKGSRSYVHAGLLERLLVKELSPLQMHPNPEDDFCQSKIGPNGGIIEHYRESSVTARYTMPPSSPSRSSSGRSASMNT